MSIILILSYKSVHEHFYLGLDSTCILSTKWLECIKAHKKTIFTLFILNFRKKILINRVYGITVDEKTFLEGVTTLQSNYFQGLG